MASLPIPTNAPDIGECIYCGYVGDDLTKEHAVPFGLNGPWTLLRASCSSCARITSRFERDVLKCLWPAVRTVLDMQTRRPKRRRANIPLVLKINGEQKIIEVPRNEFPLYLPMPLFNPPAITIRALPTTNIPPKLSFIHVAGPSFEEVCHRYGADFAGAQLNFSPNDFARTLAKIALCAAVYTLGIAPFKHTPIRSVILGEDQRIENWIGTWVGEPVNEAKGLHEMKIRAAGTEIHVVLRLFAQFGTPEYHVVLGPAEPDFVNSEAWPWK